MLNVACVHAPLLEQTFSTVASVEPDVLRTCIWIWSYVIVSGQCGWYQNVRFGLPAGTATVCVSVLLPLTAPVEPTCAEKLPERPPEWIAGRKAPLELHEPSEPVSKPGFCTTFVEPVNGATVTSSSRKYVGSPA